jgi:hypothetical protein
MKNKQVLLFRLGNLFLIFFFALSRWMLRPQHTFAQGVIDGVSGVMLGAAIGCMIWSMILKRRNCAA